MERASLEEMWNAIERFGINRKLADPKGDLSQEQVGELYDKVKEHEGHAYNHGEENQASVGA
ncbi:MAG TPA: hypothetical protein VJ792_00740 [Candidatus Nitrosotalea sp.]|nr:hypothetical protein [Candidatus Nitrosotalea sp.]